jgi:hypothetical protein
MTENRPVPVRGMMPRAAWVALLMAGGLLQACSGNPAGSAGSRLRVYAADVAGAAKTCDAPRISPAKAENAAVVMKVANDGGWCGLRAYQAEGKPFDAGLLLDRPNHGAVLVHQVGDETRIDYTPDRRFAGSDAFTVKLIPGDATIKVAVTVTAP